MVCFVIVTILWVFSVCLHEFGHAWVADKGGDHTVREKGYLTMNPLQYTDPLFSLVLPVVFLLMGGIGLPGGAVYINHQLLRSRGWDTLRNGELLDAAEAAGFDVFVTTDRNIRYQQNLTNRKIAVVVLGNGRWRLIKLRLQEVATAVGAATPGSFVEVEISSPEC